MKHTNTNTADTINKFIAFTHNKDVRVWSTSKMVIAEDENGRRRVYKDSLVDMLRIREEIKLTDALAYSQYTKGREEPITKEKQVDSMLPIGSGSEYGPQRWCQECGSTVEMTSDSGRWLCPECGILHTQDQEVRYRPDNVTDGRFNVTEERVSYRQDKYETPDLFDGDTKNNQRIVLSRKDGKDIYKWANAHRAEIKKVKALWYEDNSLSLSMDAGNGVYANPIQRDISPEEVEKMKGYSTERTEIDNRKIFGLLTGFQENMLRNGKVAKKRIESLRTLVDEEEIDYLESLIPEISLYESVFKKRITKAINSDIIPFSYAVTNKYKLTGEMWKYSSMKNKSYWDLKFYRSKKV